MSHIISQCHIKYWGESLLNTEMVQAMEYFLLQDKYKDSYITAHKLVRGLIDKQQIKMHFRYCRFRILIQIVGLCVHNGLIK